MPLTAVCDDALRLVKLFNSKKSAAKKKNVGFEFEGVTDFVNWWQGQETKCSYCETSIAIIARLIEGQHLPARNVRGEARRGPVLELDRKDPKGPYSKENCALACYYCNNDKSYIYDSDSYRKFFGPARRRHFDFLAAQCLNSSEAS